MGNMVYKFFYKKTGSGVNVNEVLAQELHKLMIKKFKRRKVYTRLKDNIWPADLAEMGSITSKNRGGKFLFCAVDVFTKYAWFKTLQDKKAKTVLNAFIKIVNESKRKLSTLWANQGEKITITLCKSG